MEDMEMCPEAIRGRVISAARAVYEELGWGWQESVYREALAHELHPMKCGCEVPMPVMYKGSVLSHVSVRWDMVVEDVVLVELKAVRATLPPAASRQCERYATNDHLWVAINFPYRPNADGIEYNTGM
jgi:GxxExxY protein